MLRNIRRCCPSLPAHNHRFPAQSLEDEFRISPAISEPLCDFLKKFEVNGERRTRAWSSEGQRPRGKDGGINLQKMMEKEEGKEERSRRGSSYISGAEGGTRTRTTLRSLDPEPNSTPFCCWMFFCYPLFSLIFCFSVLLLFPLCCSLSVPNLSQNFLRKVAVFMGDYVLPILKRNRDLQGKTDCKIDISWPRINKTETRFPYIRNKMLSPYLLSSSERLSSPSSLVIGK